MKSPARLHEERAAEIILPFVLVVAVMIGMCIISMDLMSSVRACVNGESRWSKAEKIAVAHLERYLTTSSEADFQQYRDAIAIPLAYQQAYRELDKPDSDPALVRASFLAGGINEADIPGIARLYRYFRNISYVSQAISIWREGNKHIDELAAVADEVHDQISHGKRHGPWVATYAERIRAIDETLTPLEYAFSDALGHASRKTAWLQSLEIAIVGGLLMLGATLRARRLLEDRARVARALRSSEDRFQLAVDGSNDGLWDWDRQNSSIYLAPRLQHMLGMRPSDALQPVHAIFERIHPHDRRSTAKALVAHIRRAAPLYAEFRLMQPNGAMRWFQARGQSVRDERGLPIRMAGSITEITHQRLADAMLFAEKERAEVTLQSIGDAVITTDAMGRIEYLNPSAERLTRWHNVMARGLSVYDICRIVQEASREPIADPVTQVLYNQASWTFNDKLTLEHSDGTETAIDLTVTPIRDRSGNMVGVVLVMHDVSKDREHAAVLSYQACHDVLTGLINRREFERRLEQAEIASRHTGHPFTVLYIDLDQFKIINDTCSHAAGDELLRQASAIFLAHVRQSDAVARLGGDEFVVLLEKCAHEHGLQVAENLRAAIGDLHFTHGDRTFALGASIGMVCWQGDQAARMDILAAADAACHLAKEKGRNRVQVYRESDEEVAKRQTEMSWFGRIQEAIAAHRFVLHAQDIIDLRDGHAPRHVELLLRMVDVDGKLIPPRAFIPAAERYGLMPAIDRWVVQAALSTLREGIDSGADTVPSLCSINLSGTSICENGFADFLQQQFTAHRIAPSMICFEITETSAIASLSQATMFMNRLHALGCRFSLDDFGAGMSSFTYLKHLPVDFVKIDASFVQDMIDDPIDCAMVEAINNIGHVTGKLTVAEGVETPALLDEVRRLGIDCAQGFTIARPSPFVLARMAVA